MKKGLIKIEDVMFIYYDSNLRSLVIYFRNGQIGKMVCSEDLAESVIKSVYDFWNLNQISNVSLDD